MKIAVLNETSAADRNADILHALEGRRHEVLNAGMTKTGTPPELTYIHTGFLAALLLYTKKVDFVVGGCGTGQGFLNSVMQYPGVFCGHILSPLDAWLFTQINGGNCISLMLNQGYGWAGDVNLRMIFDQIFSVPPGSGYPAHRAESQKKSRETLAGISGKVHRTFPEIVAQLPDEVILPALAFPGIRDLIDVPSWTDKTLAIEITKRMK
jgi:ribose 5-phosphate isomerase RpiB